MRNIDARVGFGVLLIVAGALFLLDSLGVIPSGLALLWIAVFGAIGGYVVYLYAERPEERWWVLIPGSLAIGIAAVIAIDELLPAAGGISGGVFLGIFGLSFWVIYLQNREFWWAIIPGGVILTTAIVAGMANVFEGLEFAGAFFLGLGLTFLLVYLLPTPEGRMTWAIIPGGVLTLMGILFGAAAVEIFNLVWPAILIALGLYLLGRGLLRRRS